MAKLVQKSGYIKSGKASGYMRYIATREGVERLAGNGAVTKGQRELIQKLLHDFPDAVELFEYEDYCKTPTLGTASAFITMALDANLHEIDSESGYMQYIATRPRVQKRGTHGLFSSATAVDLASAMSELEAHEGNVWTIIYSLRREDAARLEFDNADAWRTLLMENAPTLAKSMKISLNNFHWYAAFHDEGHHPHIHMMVWSDDPKEGFLTKDGIAAMRSKLTNAIFRDEMQQIYERKDVAYSDLVEAAQNAMREMISRMQRQVCDSPIIEDNMHQLVQTLETTTGKKQYGYLKKPLKQLVDTVVDALAELPEVSECYEVWNQIHEELNECYGHSTPWERLPLSQRKEFRKIKNDIIREAESIRLGLPTFEDEGMQDDPEPESQKEEHQSYSVYEQAQRYRAVKAVLQDIYALDAEYHNAVFVGMDTEGVPRHAHKRSANSYGKAFRLNVESSDPRYSFHYVGTGRSLYVFEAPIDMLSFITLYPENWQRHSYVACCGTSIQPVLQMLEQAPQLGTILLCLDNDEAGHQASRRMRGQLDARYSVERLIPENKDWNDDLTLSGGNAQGFSMNEMR